MTGSFAPTPSGRMHMGNAYAMLAAWLSARARHELILLRIEDIDLAQYRTMVINHEVVHALGHIDNETPCGGDKQSAPLMQEQSMFLKECSPHPWPLDGELWSTFVGSEP